MVRVRVPVRVRVRVRVRPLVRKRATRAWPMHCQCILMGRAG